MRKYWFLSILTLLFASISIAQTPYASVVLTDMDTFKLLDTEIVANKVAYDNWGGSGTSAPIYDQSGAPLFMSAGQYNTGTGIKLAPPGASTTYFGAYAEIPIPETGNAGDTIYLSTIKISGYANGSVGNPCPYIRVHLFNSCTTDSGGTYTNLGTTIPNYLFSAITPVADNPWYTSYTGNGIVLVGPSRQSPFNTLDPKCQKIRLSVGRTNVPTTHRATTTACQSLNADTYANDLFLRQIALTFSKL